MSAFARIHVDSAYGSSVPDDVDPWIVEMIGEMADIWRGTVMLEEHARAICRLYNPAWSRGGFTLSYRRVGKKGGAA